MAEKTPTDDTTTATPEPVFEAFEFEEHEPADVRRALDKSDVFEMFGFVLDRDHFRRLKEAYPEYARMITLLIDAGATPEEIEDWALSRGEHEKMAKLFEQSANYVAIEAADA